MKSIRRTLAKQMIPTCKNMDDLIRTANIIDGIMGVIKFAMVACVTISAAFIFGAIL